MNCVTAQEMYELDRKAIDVYHIPGVVLMENAGVAMTNEVIKCVKKHQSILILVGGGNNGGDGFVIAKHLINQGYQVRVVQVANDTSLSDESRLQKKMLESFGAPIASYLPDKHLRQINQADTIIDAMLGIGFKGELREPYRTIIEEVNASTAEVISIDLPSGVPANSQVEEGICAVQADLTLCIEAPKPSVFIEAYTNYYGNWTVVKIGLPQNELKQYPTRVWRMEDVTETLKGRDRLSHKGSNGRGIIIGGSVDMPGSVTLAAKGALRSGVGLLTVATYESVVPIVAQHITEATYSPSIMSSNYTHEQLTSAFSQYDALLIGMGLGRTQHTDQLISAALASNLPIVIDADGLFSLKKYLIELKERSAPTVLTPHPGEMAQLLNQTIESIKKRPFEICREFAKTYGVYLVLKGVYTIVTDPDGNQTINTTGNAGLAKGGSGDALAGIILGRVLQGGALLTSLANACFLHGRAADLSVRDHHSKTDLLASDVVDYLPIAFRECSNP
ncbi:NAD(P)H-hydrate epimerase [Pelagirhabdus alkalitolerans]|uniref:Bifunctional NAD(P)H-hydrate repair enzyme n=1 Tax=Pelagirhabdus alkalitolerans TaxID=1612202 RepID=A0A1G6JHD5_9BACI|nr:NAD(P)H-hydrate dehydratase [Pelagirhabdus alkalitolerans]SDC17336.1 NAD(P)H-hydrate epimerase [Pelagirhabdus alkalitolerans]